MSDILKAFRQWIDDGWAPEGYGEVNRRLAGLLLLSVVPIIFILVGLITALAP